MRFLIFSFFGMCIVACGNHSSTKPNGASGDETISVYAMLNNDLFAPKCSICHTAGHFSGVDTSSYQGLINSGVIDPGNPGGSLLVSSIASGFMPPRGPRISTSDDIFLLLESWIQTGASELD